MPLKVYIQFFYADWIVYIMRIYVWTGSSQCFMTQCTIELQRPPVWHQAWQSKDTSHKNVRFLLIIILQAPQNSELLARTLEIWPGQNTKNSCSQQGWSSWQCQCLLLCLTIVTWPLWPRYGQVTPAPCPLWPQCIITLTHPWPLRHQRKWNSLCGVK